MQQHSGKMFQTSFMCKSLSVYGNLPLQLQREQKMGLFVKKTKKLFLSYYWTLWHYMLSCETNWVVPYSINIYNTC